MADIQNGRCFAATAPAEEPPLFQHGSIVLQAHSIGWIVSGCFALVAVLVSFWLIDRHLVWYTNKREQRYIVRILFMVPIYAVVSFASYLYWNHSTALLLIRDCYESTVLTAFFYLLLTYLSPDVDEQKDIFRKVGLSRQNDQEARRRGTKPRAWVFPLGFVRWKPEDGLYFFQLMKWGVLQYCAIRPVTTLIAVVLNYVGLYCAASWSPGWGHIYITVIVSISVSVAMYCLIQLYIPISKHLAPYKPLLKLFAIKAVVFLTFWQATLISCLHVFGVIKDTQYMTADNVATGIGAIVETFEMMLFAFLHITAFGYTPYRTPAGPTPRLRALAHVLNFRETLRELWAGVVYMAHRLQGRETDAQARREAALEGVFGRSRRDIVTDAMKQECGEKRPKGANGGIAVVMEESVHVDVDGERYGDVETERLRGLVGEKRAGHGHGERWGEEKRGQVEREPSKAGYWKDRAGTARYDRLGQTELNGAPPAVQGHGRQRSWWRDLLTRAPGSEDLENGPAYTRVLQSSARDRDKLYNLREYEDPPPPSIIESYLDSQRRKGTQEKDVPPIPLLDDPDGPLLTAFTAPVHAPPRPAPTPLTLGPPQRHSASMLSSAAPTDSAHSDSFLGRAFPEVAYSSTSAEVVSAGTSSAESHRTRVRLVEPQVAPQCGEVPRVPEFVRAPEASGFEYALPAMPSPSAASTESCAQSNLQGLLARPAQSKSPRRQDVDSAMLQLPPQSPSGTSSSGGGPGPSAHPSQSKSPGRTHDTIPHPPSQSLSGPSSSTAPHDCRYSYDGRHNTTFFGNRFTPTRDKIVLPAPLTPAADLRAVGSAEVRVVGNANPGHALGFPDEPISRRGLRRSPHNVRRLSYAHASVSPSVRAQGRRATAPPGSIAPIADAGGTRRSRHERKGADSINS